MDEARLRAWVAEGLSLEQIGRNVGRNPSTVAYWLAKYGLSAPGRPKYAARGPIDRESLTVLVDGGATIAEIAERVDRSKATVRHWLKRFDLRTQNGVGRRSRRGADVARKAGLGTAELFCPTHGFTTHRAEPRGYFRCLRCRGEAVSKRRRKVKAILVAEYGGCCKLCGYDRSVGALQFHHLDPAAKSFSISYQGVARSLARLRAEAAKCVLLCSNCHAEVEHGHVRLSGERSLPG